MDISASAMTDELFTLLAFIRADWSGSLYTVYKRLAVWFYKKGPKVSKSKAIKIPNASGHSRCMKDMRSLMFIFQPIASIVN